MPSPLDRMTKALGLRRCCPPPPAVRGLTAVPGGGSGEVIVTWPPLPPSAGVRFYRVYRRKSAGLWSLLAIVTDETLGLLSPGRLGLVDTPDGWPWPSGADPEAERCYAVSAVATSGVEGPMSAVACGVPTS